MNLRKALCLWVATLGIAILAGSCANDYDPFTDPSKARVVVTHMSFDDNDTLNIFTTETLVVSVAVRELVDSFSIIAPANRRSPDTFTVRRTPKEPLSSGPYTYLLSLTDTGKATVSVYTYRSNKDHVFQDFHLYLRSPLHQNPVSGAYGDSIILATKPVADSDVVYHWDFGGSVVSSTTPRASGVVRMTSYGNAGLLWVSDPSGAHASPITPFSYNLIDTVGPLIWCAIPGDSAKDTIATGDTTFYFKVEIVDPNQSAPLQSASINGQNFDVVAAPYYVRVFTRMDTAIHLFPVTVAAVNNPEFLITSRKTFWLKFSDTLSHGKEALLTVTEPSGTLPTTSLDSIAILGNVYSSDSPYVVVKMRLNGLGYSRVDTVHKTDPTGQWSFVASLSSGVNIVGLAVFGPAGDSLVGQSLTIIQNRNAKDTLPPAILDVTLNGLSVRYDAINFDTTDTAVFRIIAYDQGSGIDSLLVNKKPASLSPDGHGFIWLDTVVVSHLTGGTPVTILAIDNARNRDSVSFLVSQNKPPQITTYPAASQTISVGQVFSVAMSGTDPDNDQVSFQKVEGPTGLVVAPGGQISWTPQAADTGIKKITVSLSDGYQAVTYSFQVIVTSASGRPPQVQIDTSLMHVSPYYEAGKDSVVLTVATKNDSGNTPLTFAANVNSATIPMAGRFCVWHPGIGDTGKQTLTITVTDTFSRSVSAKFPFTVVPPNRPCTLLVKYTIPVNSSGDLDLSTATQPDTLFFSVKDPDLPAVERHTVVVRLATGQTGFVLDTTGQFFILLPAKSPNGQTLDTLVVSVTDRAGHQDSLQFFIAYAPPVSPGFAGKIYISTLSSGASITSALYGFPLLVRLDTSFFTIADFISAGANGQGIRFKNASGKSLPYQIEQWDYASLSAQIWVDVDSVQPSSDSQYIMMTWNGAGMDSSNGPAVFPSSAGYVGVWHMNDASTTQNANSVQQQYPAAIVQQGANSMFQNGGGIIAGADSLSNNNYLSVGVLPSMQQVSMSAWVNPTVLTPWAKIICKSWNTYASPYQIFSLQLSAPKDTAIEFHVGVSGQYSGYATSVDSLAVKTWTHVAGTYDGVAMRLYVNGVLADSYTWPNNNAPSVPTNQQAWTIGSWGQMANESFTGKIDEARIYNGVWSADYIKLSYENQRQGSTVLRFK